MEYKPCGFVSYGGVSSGLRVVQLEKQLVTTLKMMPMVWKLLDEKGEFVLDELIIASANTLLDEQFRWGGGLKATRAREG